MITIKELKAKLKERGLQVRGTKKELLERLEKSTQAAKNTMRKKSPASVKFSPNLRNPLNQFYISTYFQAPNSKMASNYIRSRGYTLKQLSAYHNKIK